MSGPTEFLLDTNAVIALLRGDDRLLAVLGEDYALVVSVITVIEYSSFAELSPGDAELFRAFTRSVRVIDLSLADGRLLDSIVELRRTRRLKLPDAVIVASAKAYNLPLVTADAQLLQLSDALPVKGF